MSAEFNLDLSLATKLLPHSWEHTIGSGHAILALRADWQKQIEQCHRELGFQHVRFHGLLSDDMGTLLDEEDKLVYSFFNIDQAFDFLVSVGMKPFVELSFMPSTLSSGDTTVFKYRSNVTPPRDFGQWGALIAKLASHLVERYGIEEVSSWFFEVWNEPNIPSFWTGSQSDYFRLYQVTALALKNVHANLKVGGPATADNGWIPEFLDFCGAHRLPVDFVTTHHYPTDAVGTIGEDTEKQLSQTSREVLLEWTRSTRGKVDERPLYYTEWNSSSNPRDHLHDETYAACVIVRTLMQTKDLVQGYSYWTFSDIFEENYMPGTEFQGGFGMLTIDGIPKPAYRAFELLHNLGQNEIFVEGSHCTADAWASSDNGRTNLLVTNWNLPGHDIRDETVKFRISGSSAPKKASLRRIDSIHANAKGRWKEMGCPDLPSPAQIDDLKKSSEMTPTPISWTMDGGSTEFEVLVPAQGIASIVFDSSGS